LDIGVLGISVYFNIRNTLPKTGTFLLGHSVYIHGAYNKMSDDVNEGIEKALNVIVSMTVSSGNMKKELRTIIFDTVNTLRKLFVKLLENNESNNRKITDLEKQAANTNAERGEGKVKQNYIPEPSNFPVRNTHTQK